MRRTIRDTVAGLVLLAFVATYLAMEWSDRQPDTLVVAATVAIVIGAGYHLWDDSMGQGVDAAQDLQDGGDDSEN